MEKKLKKTLLRTSSNVSSIDFNERKVNPEKVWLLVLNSTGIDFDDHIFSFSFIF